MTGLRRGSIASSRVAVSAGPPVFRDSSFMVAAGSVSNPTITIPASVQVGDFMLIGHATRSGLPSGTISGWTTLRQDTNSGGLTLTISWKIAVAGSAGSAVTLPRNGRQVGTLSAWSGTGSVDVHGATMSTSDGVTLTAPSVTTTGADREIVQVWGAMNTVDLWIPVFSTVPATVRVAPSVPSSNSQPNGHQSSQAQAAAGASGTQQATVNRNSNWIATNIALRA